MTFKLTWLAQVLRAAGLTVVEQPGWQERGRAEMGQVKGVLCHHTGGPRSGDHPSLNLVINGRPDLPGPLSHLVLGRSGTLFVVAAGRCNHAGAGLWEGITAGNSSFIGIEAENAGTGADPWPEVQVDAYARCVAAILAHIGAGPNMCAGHKEYCLPRGRKIDPSFDMVAFRARVAHALTNDDTAKAPPAVAATDPVHDMLRVGDSGDSVKLLQEKLGVAADGQFGPATKAALISFQNQKGITPDGIAGPQTWAKLG